MKNKNKKLIIVVGVLLVIVVGISFAYFLTSNIFTGTGASTSLNTNNGLKVEYDAGTGKLESNNLVPSNILSKEFKVIITPTKDIKEVTYKIYINITENAFEKCTEENYDEFANDCELNAEELIYRLKDSSGNIIRTGDLTGKIGQVEIGRETKTQETKTEYSYTIEIEFKDTNKDQNHNANKTFNGNINIEFAEQVITIPDIIATNNPKTEIPDFSQVADTNEGVYSVSDGMYGRTSYYWRGAATTNYVKFAGFCWRIVRINGDKTMRLIYDGTTCHANGTNTTESIVKTSVAYNTNYNQSNYVGWTYSGTSQRTTSGTASNAKAQLESWYSSNITGTNAAKVASGKYCNDRNAGSGYTWAISPSSTFYYAALTRRDSNSPTLSCPSGDVYTLSVGLITMDEAMYAGGRGANNTSYYLYNGQDYWTMSPFYWSNPYADVFLVRYDGYLGNDWVDSPFGLRPVINLKSDTLFKTDTDGTLDNPYIVLD